MTLQKVMVAGGGTLGSQIAFQSAFHGKDVVLYDISDAALAQARERLEKLAPQYQLDLRATPELTDAAEARIQLTTDMAAAASDADLVIESIPETVAIKAAFYQQLAPLLPAKTLIATNSSTFLPSRFAAETGRPDKYLAMHFANTIWRRNTVEIMGHPGTDVGVVSAIFDYSKEIGMIPVILHKEQPGYILNSLLVPFINAAYKLWGTDVADAHTIDRVWMLATGAPRGPFGVIDVVGLRTSYEIFSQQTDPVSIAVAAKIKDRINRGYLGMESGRGFYTYPDPEYMQSGFLTGESRTKTLP
ncbi:3-hydroxyacyl-CoA dehydrogenase [Schleiferilactobacillus shenzhenensis]|uniref:3-hydroxybutyryl-CoA dehydrogenase n=1 Tax=Schleiferilactobacillus shenzhenensis LY-73 TaxID=1231336 RepID=U4TR19_9LACO|nr:3-hydroxyacyl-CoA dehydrogenase [Schleiferilactobacillus shenzhenensis]ERL63957.1 3-hydroxybutyryl-CoA dehydrogenase [Schleiferilactobacillus shenzhenensis LY-73]